MAQELIHLTKEQVSDLYRSIGKSEKQIASLIFEASETPLAGTLLRLDEEPREYQGNKYFVYIVGDKNGNEIGEISVNRFFDTEVKQGDILIIANGENKGRAMLRSYRLSSTSKFGKSRAEQIANLVGATYTGERKSVAQPKDYTKIFSNKKSYKIEKDVEETVKATLWNNTQINEKAMAITFE